MALEFVNSGIDCMAYYDEERNEFIYVGEYVDVTSEEYERIESSISLPNKFEIDEYAMMEDFIETIDNPKIANKLWMAISGKRAFRRFKDACIYYRIEDDWYSFRDEMYKDIAIKWCKKNNVRYE